MINNITFRDKIKRITLVKNKIKKMIECSVETPEQVDTKGKNFILIDKSFKNFQFINKEMRKFTKNYANRHYSLCQIGNTAYKIITGREAFDYEVEHNHFKVGYYIPAIDKLLEIIGKAESELGTTINITQTMPDEHLIKLEEILFGDGMSTVEVE
jgi:hypothetical protein